MLIIELLSTAFRESLSQRQTPREPEPTMAMEVAESVEAFRDAGAPNGPMAGAYLFSVARASQALHGCRRVVDLGCGPARFLAQVALLNPEIEFLGVDLSDAMLASAAEHLATLGIKNVKLQKGDITDLSFLASKSFDGVMSTLALHHLPTMKHLRLCFHEIHRILIDDGALYLFDLGRPKSLKTILAMAYIHEKRQAHAFSVDSERSWRAAFLPEDFRTLAAEELPGRDLECLTTWISPLMMMLKSKDRALDPDKIGKLKTARKNLSSFCRSDLDQLRYFFKRNGLQNDLF